MLVKKRVLGGQLQPLLAVHTTGSKCCMPQQQSQPNSANSSLLLPAVTMPLNLKCISYSAVQGKASIEAPFANPTECCGIGYVCAMLPSLPSQCATYRLPGWKSQPQRGGNLHADAVERLRKPARLETPGYARRAHSGVGNEENTPARTPEMGQKRSDNSTQVFCHPSHKPLNLLSCPT